jgi:hypothetical protein
VLLLILSQLRFIALALYSEKTIRYAFVLCICVLFMHRVIFVREYTHAYVCKCVNVYGLSKRLQLTNARPYLSIQRDLLRSVDNK